RNYPELENVLSPLLHLIDDNTMIQLNYEVEILQKSPEEVAFSFLKSHQLLQ
ncbi:MAG: hypothetical protein K0B37_18280, partial [Bacteroidales bacterium]|nr:hypothetical protein [Bacteroidales bacterium]